MPVKTVKKFSVNLRNLKIRDKFLICFLWLFFPLLRKISPFHLVEISPWPLLVSSLLLGLLLRLVVFFKRGSTRLCFFNLGVFLLVLFLWWRDVDREVVYRGAHTSFVQRSHKVGFILFISREVIFFFRFFWRFFHNSLSPDTIVGCIWPPLGITPLNTFQVPLLNTAILLLRGVSVM